MTDSIPKRITRHLEALLVGRSVTVDARQTSPAYRYRGVSGRITRLEASPVWAESALLVYVDVRICHPGVPAEICVEPHELQLAPSARRAAG